MILTMAICIQINTINDATKTVGTTLKDNTGLKDELLNVRGNYENLYKQLEEDKQPQTIMKVILKMILR